MPRLNAPAPTATPPAQVNVGPEETTMTLTIVVPKKKTYTADDIARIQREKGKTAVAVCDITGELIFNAKNVNEVHNGERPEFDGKTISTAVMKALFDAAGVTTTV